MEENEKKALEGFLTDIDCLDPLSKWSNSFNLFDVLGISRMEIRHSNMLAWLLDPNENHGFGDLILRGVIQCAIDNVPDDKRFSTLLMDYKNFSIWREWKNIDILAISHKDKFVLCIENKVDSGERSDQLKRYQGEVKSHYAEYTQMYILLSPDEREASENSWWAMGYGTILNILEQALKRVTIRQDVRVVIDNYIEVVRRLVMGNNDLETLCTQIYNKHKEALDLIYEYRADNAKRLADVIQNWAKECDLQVEDSKTTKKYLRFKTDYMTSLMPEQKDSQSEWGTGNFYYYEVVNDKGESFHMQLAFSLKYMPGNLRTKSERICKALRTAKKDIGDRWCVAFKTSSQEVNYEMDEQEIKGKLDELLRELNNKEDILKGALNNN